MPLLRPQDLETGMVLAADVSNLDGQILFKKGVELKERQIEILQMWGISEVEIAGDETPVQEVSIKDIAPRFIERAREIVSSRFKLIESTHPATAAVKEISIQRTAITLSKEGEA